MDTPAFSSLALRALHMARGAAVCLVKVGAASRDSGGPADVAGEYGWKQLGLDHRRVPAAGLNDWLVMQGVDRPDILQIDADGHEWSFIEQLNLSRYRPALVWWRSAWMPDQERKAARAHLFSAGYRIVDTGEVATAIDTAQVDVPLAGATLVTAVLASDEGRIGPPRLGAHLLSLCSLAKMKAPFVVYTQASCVAILKQFADDEQLTWDVVGVDSPEAAGCPRATWLANAALRNPFLSAHLFWVDADLSSTAHLPEAILADDGFDCDRLTPARLSALCAPGPVAVRSAASDTDVLFGGSIDALWSDHSSVERRDLADWLGLDDTQRAPAIGRRPPVDVTVVINTYKRPHTLRPQYEAVINQTCPPRDIFVWQNHPDASNGVPVEPETFDSDVLSRCATVKSLSTNFGVWGRFAFALNARTKYVCVLDDDTIPGARWIENCLATMQTHRGLLGTVGIIQEGESFWEHRRVGWCAPNERVEAVDYVGHAWFFEREWLTAFWRELPKPELFAPGAQPHALCAGEDMHFSFMLKKYLGLQTFVPPHPDADRALWGSDPALAREFGCDAVAISNLGPEHSKFEVAWADYRARGFRFLYEG